MTYQASTIKRARRTKAQVQQLERQIYAVLAADHPQSVRHVFYRMTDPRLPEPVEKTQRGYDHVQNRMVQMRRAGLLPYGWITDSTRRGYHVNTFQDAGEFVAAFAGLYRADLWGQSDHYVEVWCESRSIAGTIESTCRDLAVSLYPAGGFSSLTLAFQAAEYIKNESRGRPAEIIYIGDYDPAGVVIDKSIESELRRHLAADIDLVFHRVAITPEQIEEFDLPTKLRKPGDKRSAHIERTVEAEAMPASQLRGLLRDAIESFLPPGALDVVKVAEQSERDGLHRLGAALQGFDIHAAVDALWVD